MTADPKPVALPELLRSLSRHEHSDTSIAADAADEIDALRAEVDARTIALLAAEADVSDLIHRAERAEAQAAAAERLAAKWRREWKDASAEDLTDMNKWQAADELEAALSRAANDTQAGGGGSSIRAVSPHCQLAVFACRAVGGGVALDRGTQATGRNVEPRPGSVPADRCRSYRRRTGE